jgi:hypothetical protein
MKNLNFTVLTALLIEKGMMIFFQKSVELKKTTAELKRIVRIVMFKQKIIYQV